MLTAFGSYWCAARSSIRTLAALVSAGVLINEPADKLGSQELGSPRALRLSKLEQNRERINFIEELKLRD